MGDTSRVLNQWRNKKRRERIGWQQSARQSTSGRWLQGEDTLQVASGPQDARNIARGTGSRDTQPPACQLGSQALAETHTCTTGGMRGLYRSHREDYRK